MSIGNLKDTGNQGNNMPWQWKMLQGIQALIDQSNTCCTDLTALLQPQERNAYVEVTTGGGATTANTWYSISIANIGTAAGLVNGASIPTGTILNFDAGVLNNTLGAGLTWDAAGTTFLITGLLTPAT